MADWHLKELDEELRARGWRIVARHPGDGRHISASWEVQRSTRFPSVFIDFYGTGEWECLPLEEADACGVRGRHGSSIHFGSQSEKWRDGVRALVDALDYSEHLFTLDYKIHDSGSSAEVWLYPGSVGPIDLTHISSGLNGLAYAVAEILRSEYSTRVTCSWLDEPGETRWVLLRLDNQVSIRVLRFRDYSPNLSDEKGKLLFEAQCSLMRLASQVLAQIARAEREFVETGYQTRWQGEFPSHGREELLRLLEMSRLNSG